MVGSALVALPADPAIALLRRRDADLLDLMTIRAGGRSSRACHMHLLGRVASSR